MRTVNSSAERLMSLDAFRGFDMLLIMGLGGLLQSLAWCWHGGTWEEMLSVSTLAQQMTHVPWHGLHVMDLVFPTFLFIAGISFPFSYAKQVARGDSARTIYLRLLKRALVLIAFGVVYNGFFKLTFPMRYWSVLGKIGFAWFFAALFYVHVRTKGRIAICAGIMLGYWALTRFVVAPDAPAGTDPFSLEGCIGGWIDRHTTPGLLYLQNKLEPSGLFHNIVSIPTAMLGMFVGEWVRRADVSGGRKTVGMLLGAAVLGLAGLAVAQSFPINKMVWSPSFTLVAGAVALAFFAVFYWTMDVKKWRAWAFCFQVIGMNSITIYMLQRFVDFNQVATCFLGGICRLAGSEPVASSLIYFGHVVLCWLVLWFLYRQKVFLRV